MDRPSKFTFDNAAYICFLLLVFSLGFMQPFVFVQRHALPLTDFIFIATFLLWTAAVLFRQTSFRWHRFFWLLVMYGAAMGVSAVFSEDPSLSFIKLLGVIYLFSLPVLAFNIVSNERRLKNALHVWLAAVVICAAVGVVSVFLYYLDRDAWLLSYTLFDYGTLPPGDYPRICSTFLNANMLANYLSVGLMITLVLRGLGLINKAYFLIAGGAIVTCACFTISPGLGGIALSVGLWLWLRMKQVRPLAAYAALFCGVALSLLFLLAASISPVILFEPEIKASPRAMVWWDSLKTFLEDPVLGRGLGLNACKTYYVDLSGRPRIAADAHNTFLNVAAQTGIVGLVSLLFVIWYFARRLFPFRADTARDLTRMGLGLAFISGFVYQGLTGSFEDARHLWVLAGLILAADSVGRSVETRSAPTA